MAFPSADAATAEVGSNIALIKYWGKRPGDQQWPANDSLSMTLSAARTITQARLHPRAGDGLLPADDEIHRAGQVTTSREHPRDKALAHLARLRQEVGPLAGALIVHTHNTFPSDCGIASSASGLGALTLAALGAWTGASNLGELEALGYSRERLAHLARMGSGSAGRSFYAGYVRWEAGEHACAQTIRQLFPAEHWRLADLIVMVSAAPKPVSSTVAHDAAWTSPLYGPRLAGLGERRLAVEAALAKRDMQRLGELIETEALEMHAVMMTSEPAARYLTPKTLEVLAWIRRERALGNLPAWFTLDAGTNIHVLCEAGDASLVQSRIRAAFPDCPVLADCVGDAPLLTRRPMP